MSEFKNSVVILDTRPRASIQAGHIAGATAIAPDKLAQMQAVFPTKKNAPVVIVADSDETASQAFSVIRGWGYKNASILQGGFGGWQKAGFETVTGSAATDIVYVPKPVPGAITVDDFKSIVAGKTKDTVIIDVRTEDEVAAGTMPGALNIPTEEIAGRIAEIPKDKKIITFCSTGIRAEMAYIALKDKGYSAKFLNGKMEFSENAKYTIAEN